MRKKVLRYGGEGGGDGELFKKKKGGVGRGEREQKKQRPQNSKKKKHGRKKTRQRKEREKTSVKETHMEERITGLRKTPFLLGMLNTKYEDPSTKGGRGRDCEDCRLPDFAGKENTGGAGKNLTFLVDAHTKNVKEVSRWSEETPGSIYGQGGFNKDAGTQASDQDTCQLREKGKRENLNLDREKGGKDVTGTMERLVGEIDMTKRSRRWTIRSPAFFKTKGEVARKGKTGGWGR